MLQEPADTKLDLIKRRVRADTYPMKQISALEIHTRNNPDHPTSAPSRKFSRVSAVMTITIYSLFSMAVMAAVPELAHTSAMWQMWAAVTLTAAVTYRVGQHP